MAFELFEEAKASQIAITSTLCGCLTGKKIHVILSPFTNWPVGQVKTGILK